MTTLSVIEIADAIADAAGWPRSRPARVLIGDRATVVESLSFVLDEHSIDEVQATGSAAVLSTPPGPQFARVGRRHHDPLLEEGGPVADWIRAERVVIDASELLAGGAGGYDDRLAALIADGTCHPYVSVARDEYKLVGFVPADALGSVRSAIFDAGAGRIGNYSECSFGAPGTGTFRGGEGSKPAAGSAGTFEQVDEVRFETVIPSRLRDAVCRAFVAAHPYEEPAYDVQVLATPARVGFGRLIEGALDHAAVSARLNGAGLVAKVLGPGSGQVGRWVVTGGSLQPLIADIVTAADVAGVVAGTVTPAERRLLESRGVSVVIVERSGVLRTLGPAVVEGMALRLGVDARFLAPLEFPGARA